jgi:hypothetical protein
MRFSDYVCDRCDKIFEYGKKNDLDSFPAQTECPECKQSDKTRRVWSNITMDIAEGRLGNYKNGYSNNTVNFPSNYGTYKGTRV